MPFFSFGQSKEERLEVEVMRYERRATGEYYDDNWLVVEIRVGAGGFRGRFEATILTSELEAFIPQLRSLHATLLGFAEFTTLETQLHLCLKGDGKGQIELTGEASDQPGLGNHLRFRLQFDQTHLGSSIRELEKVVSEFPVRAV